MPAIERLYTIFKPNNYKLDLNLNIDNLTLYGRCQVAGELVGNNTKIKLHSKDLSIKNVRSEGRDLEFNVKDDILIIEFNNSNQNVFIDITYSASITKAMHGIYPSTTSDGKTIISTQFESHHAREAFPCVDEPEAKATFDVTITAPSNNTFLGNMPIKEQANKADKTTTIFETSPIMSTYLLAFVVGDLISLKAKTKDGVDVAIWAASSHKANNLKFSLDVSVKTIEFLNDYFDVKYPLPKLDQVAIPDFSSGAMENWGLVTYREIALLVDPTNASASSKEMVALVIAHELSHQWFGNLVTMKWWDDLWLNESFATLMEYIVINNIFPEWNIMLNFASHEALSAYRRDILPGVQSVATSVNHPDEISTLFDPSIVYAKGARLLWMAFNIVGEQAFRSGLKSYFKSFAYGNTKGADLWRALGQASGIDVSSIMQKWLTQPGLPFISINETSAGIELEQNRLTSTGPTNDTTWPIPLWPDSNLSISILDEKTVKIKTGQRNIRFNNVGGHYVCEYLSKQTRDKIRQNIANKTIPADSRLLLLSDAILLSQCGVAPIHQMLDSIKAYKNEDQEAVWSMISLALSDVKMLIEGQEELETKLKSYVYNLVKAEYDRLGWEGNLEESSNDSKLRSIITNLAVYSENQAVINQAIQIYRNKGLDKLNSDSRTAVLGAVVKHGTNDEFTQLLLAYPSENNADIKIDIGGALCGSKDGGKIVEVISRLKDEDFVRLQDLDRFIVYLLRNRYGREQIWEWLVNNWEWISEKFASDKSYDSYPRYAASAFSNEHWLAKYKDLFLPLSNIPALTRNIEIGINDIENKISWRQKEEADLITWLKAQ